MSVADGLEYRVVYQGGRGLSLPGSPNRRGRSVLIRQTEEVAAGAACWAKEQGCEVRVDVRQVGPWIARAALGEDA